VDSEEEARARRQMGRPMGEIITNLELRNYEFWEGGDFRQDYRINMMWMLPSLSELPPSHEAMAGQDGGKSRRFYHRERSAAKPQPIFLTGLHD